MRGPILFFAAHRQCLCQRPESAPSARVERPTAACGNEWADPDTGSRPWPNSLFIGQRKGKQRRRRSISSSATGLVTLKLLVQELHRKTTLFRICGAGARIEDPRACGVIHTAIAITGSTPALSRLQESQFPSFLVLKLRGH